MNEKNYTGHSVWKRGSDELEGRCGIHGGWERRNERARMKTGGAVVTADGQVAKGDVDRQRCAVESRSRATSHHISTSSDSLFKSFKAGESSHRVTSRSSSTPSIPI